MDAIALRQWFERRQIPIYFLAMASAGILAYWYSGTAALDEAVTPALAAMLFLTFLQVPIAGLGRDLLHPRFLLALLAANFIVVPLLVAVLFPLLPADSGVQLGVLLVLLMPCIDYVITFSHIGKANSRLLLAATPLLLAIQIVLLPGYLGLFLGTPITRSDVIKPFIYAFVTLIMMPLALAALWQWLARRHVQVARVGTVLDALPVPATALVLFLVVGAVLPQLGEVTAIAMQVAPVYLAFALISPLLGWLVARVFQLDIAAVRAVAFSSGTRNSLVVLPLALSIPNAAHIMPVVILTQTMVELMAQLGYVRWIPLLPGSKEK